MRKDSFLYRVYDLYYEGFKNMTLGKTLWKIILIKLFIMFVILKLFFFPNFLKSKAPDGKEADYVGNEMVKRVEGGASDSFRQNTNCFYKVTQ